MANARRSDAWDRASAIMSLIANVNRDAKSKPDAFKPDQFHPFYAAPLPTLAQLREE